MKALPYSKQQGWTLVELMVALTLSLFLMLTVTYVVGIGMSTYRQKNAINRVQDSSNLAVETLTREIRQAVYVPCGSAGLDAQYGNKPSPVIRRDILPASATPSTDPIINFTNVGATDYIKVFPAQDPWTNGSVPANLLLPSSVIELVSMANENYTLMENTGTNANTIKIRTNPGDKILQNDYMILVNCAESGESFGEYVRVNAVTNASPSVITLTQALKNQYSANSRLIRPTAKQYYVTKNTSNNTVNLNVREFQRNGGWVGAPGRPLLFNVSKFDVKVGLDKFPADVNWQTDSYEPADANATAVTKLQNGPDIQSLLITYRLESNESYVTTDGKPFSRPEQSLLISLRNRTD